MREGVVLDGRYRLQSLLGRGGFGSAWSAQDLRLGRAVAVKTGWADSDEAARRLVREAELAGSLSHPNIATVHDVGRVGLDGRPLVYIVMELVPGADLARVLARGLPRFEDTVGWARQICAALAAAHDAGIVHRDIKPANVVVTADGAVKVLDFGIARRRDGQGSTVTAENVVIGSHRYMAPERWRGGPVDGRSDLYALGCVLMELWTGRPPFPGEQAHELAGRHATAPPPSPSAFRPGLPTAADRLVLDLLAKDPDRRPPHAREVERRLGLLIGPAVPAAPAAGPAAPGYSPTVVADGADGTDPERHVLRRRLDRITALPADDFEEFRELIDELIPEARRELGPDDVLTVEAVHVRALRTWERQPVEHELAGILPKLVRVFGAEDRRTIEVRAHLVGFAALRGARSRAVIAELEEIIDLATRVLGPFDPITLRARVDRAWGLDRFSESGAAAGSGRARAAALARRRALFEPLTADLVRGLPETDGYRWEAHRVVAGAAHELGDHRTAARLWDEMYGHHDLMPRYGGWAEGAVQYAHSVGEAGDPARAAAMLDDLIPRIPVESGYDSPLLARAQRLRSRFRRQVRRAGNGDGDEPRRSWFRRG